MAEIDTIFSQTGSTLIIQHCHFVQFLCRQKVTFYRDSICRNYISVQFRYNSGKFLFA